MISQIYMLTVLEVEIGGLWFEASLSKKFARLLSQAVVEHSGFHLLVQAMWEAEMGGLYVVLGQPKQKNSQDLIWT
jgi:hypothetical protein